MGWELKLEDFEDDDCIESPESDLLLPLSAGVRWGMGRMEEDQNLRILGGRD